MAVEIPSLTQEQKRAVVGCLCDPEHAKGILEDCAEFSDDVLAENFSGYRRAVERYISELRVRVEP